MTTFETTIRLKVDRSKIYLIVIYVIYVIYNICNMHIYNIYHVKYICIFRLIDTDRYGYK